MTLNALRRLIRTLLVALGAPACTIARVWRCEARAISGFAHPLERCQKRGWWLRYNGENDATVTERIVRLEWIAQAPDGERRDRE